MQASLSVYASLTFLSLSKSLFHLYTGRSHKLYQQSMVIIHIIMLIAIINDHRPHVHPQYYNPFMSTDKNGYGLTSNS